MFYKRFRTIRKLLWEVKEDLADLVSQQKQTNERLNKMAKTQAEGVAKLKETLEVLNKVSEETSTLLVEIQDLKDAAASNPDELSPELEAAIEAVSSRAINVDNQVKDVAPTV